MKKKSPQSALFETPGHSTRNGFFFRLALAFIPLQNKTPRDGDTRWAIPPTREFRVGGTNMLVYLKFVLPPTQTPTGGGGI